MAGFRGLYELLIGRLSPSSPAPPELIEINISFAHSVPLETNFSTGNVINATLGHGLTLETLFATGNVINSTLDHGLPLETLFTPR